MTVEQCPYRPELPPVPQRLLRRPVVRGFPVPWFVAEQAGGYDFRVTEPSKFAAAIMDHRCWICGGRMGAYKAFVIGPMCAVNRTTAEPPSHRECALWAAVACPFLNQRQSRRREGDLPELNPPPGEPIFRQAGATLVWVTKAYTLFNDGHDGVLIEIGEPLETLWYAHGRAATRDEVLASIESGLPILQTIAEEEGAHAVASLADHVTVAMRYVPL